MFSFFEENANLSSKNVCPLQDNDACLTHEVISSLNSIHDNLATLKTQNGSDNKYLDNAIMTTERLLDLSDGALNKYAIAANQHVIRQLNPHFIFNTLATIRVITKIDPYLAYDMIYDFSKYLRAVFQSLSNPGNILFSEEAANIISYTNLVKIRFGENISINFDIEENDFMIPPMTLLPLVENAIIHGLKKGRIKGTVIISCRQGQSEYIVGVKDNGAGFDTEAYKSLKGSLKAEKGGLCRVRYQIENIMGGNVKVYSVIGTGTVITLHIPKIPKTK